MNPKKTNTSNARRSHDAQKNPPFRQIKQNEISSLVNGFSRVALAGDRAVKGRDVA
jgi:hypothetical protein